MTPAEALAQYDGALVDYRKAVNGIADISSALVAAKRAADDSEADVLVNGGTPEHPIDGKNAETRTAQLNVALRSLPGVANLQEKVTGAEKVLAQLNAQKDCAIETIRHCRAVLEYEGRMAEERAAMAPIHAYKSRTAEEHAAIAALQKGN